MPGGCENWPITVTLLAASGKGECLERKVDRNNGVSPIHAKNRPAFDNQRDCQTVGPPNYEIEGRLLCTNRMRRRFPEAKIRFLN